MAVDEDTAHGLSLIERSFRDQIDNAPDREPGDQAERDPSPEEIAPAFAQMQAPSQDPATRSLRTISGRPDGRATRVSRRRRRGGDQTTALRDTEWRSEGRSLAAEVEAGGRAGCVGLRSALGFDLALNGRFERP